MMIGNKSFSDLSNTLGNGLITRTVRQYGLLPHSTKSFSTFETGIRLISTNKT